MAQAQTTKKSGFSVSPAVVIIIALIVSFLIFYFVFGDVSHFTSETKKEPKPGDILGIIYKGGIVVPFLMATLITCITFAIERLLTIGKAAGTGSLETFLQNIKSKLASNDINGALAECNKQKGAVANVVQSGLNKYAEMEKNTELAGEQKVLNIQKEIEESTSLELPALEKNMWILATIASVGTLIALFGTVLGMIRAFAALATSGTPDPSALASGISEALINTALGIFTSAIAIIVYNLCTTKIDKLTYSIDEMGYSISQSFASRKH
jgi:biopolymer transport protein ExbB